MLSWIPRQCKVQSEMSNRICQRTCLLSPTAYICIRIHTYLALYLCRERERERVWLQPELLIASLYYPPSLLLHILAVDKAHLYRNQKTIRLKKGSPSGSKGLQLRKHIDATLGSGNLREAVKLPPGEDVHEWWAVNTVDFFNQVNILYSTLTEFCTPSTCPTMTAGPKYEYRWADGKTIKKPIVVSAPEYVDYLMDWIEAQLDDESIFPQKLGVPFPPNFRDVVKTILKRLFRVYAHIYHSHFQKIVCLKEEAHLNTCFKHFVLFTSEFGLVEKAELAALDDIVESILQR